MWATPRRSWPAAVERRSRSARIARGVDPGRRQEHLAEGQRRRGSPAPGASSPAAEDPAEQLRVRPRRAPGSCSATIRAHERVAVGVQPGRGEADERVAGPGRGAVEQPVALDDADAEAGQVELVGLHQARVLGRLAADERAAGQRGSRRRSPPTSAATRSGIEPPDRDVVEEEERLGAGADDVVGAHRDEVAGRSCRSRPRAARDRGLGADAVRGADQDRLADSPPGRAIADGEAAQAAEHLRAPWSRRRRRASARPPARRPSTSTPAARVGVPRPAPPGPVPVGAQPHGPRGAPSLTGLREPARLLLEHELVAGRVVRHGHRVAAVEAGEAEPLVRQVERRRARRRSRGSASESAPTNSRISSTEWVAAISSVSICVSMP